MDAKSDISLKNLCCTCLSKDRKLFQLCRIHDGVNNLYWLLSYDPEAYREGFHKDATNLFICWECRAIVHRIIRFRQQACAAQRLLATISEGRPDSRSQHTCLSRLSYHQITRQETYISQSLDNLTDNFVDCGVDADIKTESDEDIPLSELHLQSEEEEETTDKKTNINKMKLSKKSSRKTGNFNKKTKIKHGREESCFSSVTMNASELAESLVRRKSEANFSNAPFKCESCIEIFNSQTDLDIHNSVLHVENGNHSRCDICLSYVESSSLIEHRVSHDQSFKCRLCTFTAYSLTEIKEHLFERHAIKLLAKGKRKKDQSDTNGVLKSGSKTRRNRSAGDRGPSGGHKCGECNQYFENKNQRWKHVQRTHRDGYQCSSCEKRFAFKTNLARHELLHAAPPPREECPVCHKAVRLDLRRAHARTHAPREAVRCRPCDKRFVSRASYEHHLKYTQAHAGVGVLKYKCASCGKGYRSRGELRDHVNYQHIGSTQHKCPECGKALATRRCVTRHVRRAHLGLKENARDKICQQCGKAFRDKKGLREHEWTHSGERPLACAQCQRTFRQSAALHAHRRRVHRVPRVPDT